MEPIPPPPELKRQSAGQIDPPTSWWREHYNRAIQYWKNSSGVFPEYFQGDILIMAVRVTHQTLDEIILHDPNFRQRQYFLGDYVGKVIRHVNTDANDCYPGDILFTPMSYYTYSNAIYEASLMAEDSIRTVVRHVLYNISPIQCFPEYPSIQMMAECIITKGLYPSEANVLGDLNSDHVRVSSPHPPE